MANPVVEAVEATGHDLDAAAWEASLLAAVGNAKANKIRLVWSGRTVVDLALEASGVSPAKLTKREEAARLKRLRDAKSSK